MADKDLREELIQNLLRDVTGEEDNLMVDTDTLKDTINNIMKTYNLSTDLSFVEKIATMRFGDKKNETFDIEAMPKELKDAAFLPVTTITDIAIKQDIDLMVSQIPEWYTALTVTRDAICESDIVTGKLSRDIRFDTSNTEDESDNALSKVEETEERLDLHSMIKNHVVFNTLLYGESYVYCIPYAKVFEDLYKYRLTNDTDKKNGASMNMFDTSSIMNGMGYGESVEISLRDASIKCNPQKDNKTTTASRKVKNHVFSEAEIMEFYPQYNNRAIMQNLDDSSRRNKKSDDESIDYMLEDIASNIRYISDDIALPIIEESAHDLREVYETKYRDNSKFINEAQNVFEQVMMEADFDDRNGSIDPKFANIKGIYTRILPATKLIPIRVDREVIGYYYISDMTRREESDERKNSGLSGYSLRTPSVGYDTFSPDRVFCEKLASKIINNFDLKFMHDNTSLHQQIVAILESHKFNESMMRFIFIPAEHVCRCTINRDGGGKGHSMLEPGLITARMYMFLKLYSILYQINNSQVRVYNLRMSGIDKNYKKMVQDTIRKFSARRITANDIFNYRSSMTKVSGGSELVMPLGAGDVAPITFEKIDACDSPINNELLENLKNEAINSTPVPSAMVQGAMSELDFAKEVELANTRFKSYISSIKIDMNRDITVLYRRIMRWETDIDPEILKDMKFVLRMPAAKELAITNEMISNFNSIAEILIPTFLKEEEIKGEKQDNPTVVREFRKLILQEFIPQINIERFEELADQARSKAAEAKLNETQRSENIVADQDNMEEF